MKKTVILCLVAVLLLSLCACGGSSYTETDKINLYAAIDIDGNVYFPSQNGTVDKVSAEAYSAIRTKDRKHAVILEVDGTLSIHDGTNKTVIDEDVRTISLLHNNALFYYKLANLGKYYPPEDYSYESYHNNVYTYYRYSFATGESVEMVDDSDYCTSQNGEAMLYTEGTGAESDAYSCSLYLIREGETEPTKITSSKQSMYPIAVSRDGSVYAWAEASADNSCNIYIFDGVEQHKAFSLDEAVSYGYYGYFNESEDFLVVLSTHADYVAIWSKSSGVSKIRLTSAPSGSVYTDKGYLRNYNDISAGTVYVQTNGDNGLYNLYAVTLSGDREKLVSGIDQLVIHRGHLYYIDGDTTLYCASLKDGTISEITEVADGVCDMTVSPDGSAVVYVRDVASDCIGSLYYYATGAEDSVRIESEAFCDATYYSYLGYWGYYLDAAFSNDSKTVYYFVDGSEIQDTGTYCATLMQYDIKSGESTRIGSDVIPDIESEYLGGYPESKAIWYYKYTAYDNELGILCDLMFWNGEKPVSLAYDIDY